MVFHRKLYDVFLAHASSIWYLFCQVSHWYTSNYVSFWVLRTSTRLLNWRFSLFFILLSILVVIPFAISLFLTIGTPGWLSRLFLVYPSYPPTKMFYRSSSLLSTTHRQSSCSSKSRPSPHLPLRIIAYPFTSRLNFIRCNHYCVIPTHSSWNYHPWSFIWFWSD